MKYKIFNTEMTTGFVVESKDWQPNPEREKGLSGPLGLIPAKDVALHLVDKCPGCGHVDT